MPPGCRSWLGTDPMSSFREGGGPLLAGFSARVAEAEGALRKPQGAPAERDREEGAHTPLPAEATRT
eukprot:8300379-Alexandrium_andersonii.AAC.1